jgi:tetratricopeptide (TPR) repeat protein
MKTTSVALVTIALTWGLTSPFLLAQAPSQGAVNIEDIGITTPTEPPVEGGLNIETGLNPSKPVTPAPGGAPAQEVVALPESAKALSPEDQEKLRILLTEASAFVQGIRVQEALERIFEAQQMAPEYAVVYNLEGAAWTKAKEFDKAKVAFKKCLSLDPESLEARFNLAELEFVSKNYEQALLAFDTLIADEPRFPARTRNLILYKIFLCNLMLDNTEKVNEMLAAFNYMSDTPEYYYANAAIAFHADDKDEARSWLRSAARIYSRMMQELFVDSLVELKWIETL